MTNFASFCFSDAELRPHVPSDTLDRVQKAAQSDFSRAKGSHDWDHTLRVLRLAVHIARQEGADEGIVRAAAYLHDIGRAHPDDAGGKCCHAKQGVIRAQSILFGESISPETRENILHCIAAHRFRQGEPPRTLEAKVLFDADKLDAIGAIGVARAFLFAGEIGARLHSPEVAHIARMPAYSIHDTGYREYVVKLSVIHEQMLTATGRHLAQARHRFMVDFFDRFLEEYEGER
ncbi:HD domain-containing protein [Desulfosarcina sp. OttesenSCG-928-A07]|nr:HD domain-containing protein [Desulfosarcina sp. OttesenSCG-928-A07]